MNYGVWGNWQVNPDLDRCTMNANRHQGYQIQQVECVYMGYKEDDLYLDMVAVIKAACFINSSTEVLSATCSISTANHVLSDVFFSNTGSVQVSTIFYQFFYQ